MEPADSSKRPDPMAADKSKPSKRRKKEPAAPTKDLQYVTLVFTKLMSYVTRSLQDGRTLAKHLADLEDVFARGLPKPTDEQVEKKPLSQHTLKLSILSLHP